MVTPPIFCAGYRTNRSTTASAHLPPKSPSCGGVAQDFVKSCRGQHGQPKYLSRRAVVIGKPTKELNGMSPTMLGMRHSSCRRPKRSANGPEAHQCPLLTQSGQSSGNNQTYLKSKSSSWQRLSGCLLASIRMNDPNDVREMQICLMQIACFCSESP